MAICKTCGANDLLKSDICGEHCIYCFGTSTEKPAYNGKLICCVCGKEVKVLHNDMCYDHYLETR